MDSDRSRVDDEDASDSPNLGGWGAGSPCTGRRLLHHPAPVLPARGTAAPPAGALSSARRLRLGAHEVADPSSRVEEPHTHDDADDKGNAMSDEDTTATTGTESDLQREDGSGEGIELTTGEPNTFEPEEDPDAADG